MAHLDFQRFKNMRRSSVCLGSTAFFNRERSAQCSGFMVAQSCGHICLTAMNGIANIKHK